MSDSAYLLYLIASVLFILALKGLSSPETARRGNVFGICGMAVAVGATLYMPSIVNYTYIIAGVTIGGLIGTVIAKKIQMTAMPQLVAAFHSLVGMAAVLIASAALWAPESYGIGAPGHLPWERLVEMGLGSIIGAITFSGSVIAFAKLQELMSGNPIVFKGQHQLNGLIALGIIAMLVIFCGNESKDLFMLMTAVSFLIGFMLIIPIGGADMPVVVSVLNSYSGWAAVGIGFTLGNPSLIVTGSLVGSSGAILSYIMCKAMNRSIINVIAGGFGGTAGPAKKGGKEKPVKSGSPEDAAFLLKNASSVIIVPGYGMAVGQAQHATRELGEVLEKEGVRVRYAIHPVAGRMPGHMNVLLAEANVPYDQVLELEEINPDFASTDVVFVIGANDVTNPAAHNDPQSPIYGMPILDVENAKTVIFNKRGMGVGYAGIQNELFFHDNTMMLFGDAKKATEALVKAIKES